MKTLTLTQAFQLIDDITNESLGNYNTNHPDNKISHDDSYKLGFVCTELACLLSNISSVEAFMNKYKNLLSMDVTKDE